MDSERPLVVGITGASGAPYAKRLVEVLLQAGREVHVCASSAALQVMHYKLGRPLTAGKLTAAELFDAPRERLRVWQPGNLTAGMASGSFRTGGMVIIPCSMGTLAAIAHGQGLNLIHRAAEVHLKERRKLILVPRETPLSLIGIENMAAVTRAGALVLPAMPGFYHQPCTLADLIDFIVARVCDHLEVSVSLVHRWGEAAADVPGEACPP